ncbi:MAG: hypothetical protein WAQ25_02000 [Candidatus Saccharimonas sp.]
METKDIVLLAVTLLILGEVTFLLAKLPRTHIKAKDRAVLVDTSVLMDGRITGVATTGFIGGTLVIPRSVVGELQFLADNADADKRARARRGLDIITELQHMPTVNVELLQDGSRASEGVDERLLLLAKQHDAVICTIDYNLNKVAAVEGIAVLNINELAQSLRMSHLPGEHVVLELVQKGQDNHQAVGYLGDGTMVVVEQSSNMIGQQVEVEVVRSLQTAAGKMMFARRVGSSSTPDKSAEKPKPQGRKPQIAAPATTSVRQPRAPKLQQQASSATHLPQTTRRPGATAYHKPKHAVQPNNRSRRAADREAAFVDLANR